MAHVKVESVSPAIAGAKKFTIELPHRWWQWVIAVILAIIIVFTGLFLSGMHTGRIGFVPVEGNSMQSVFPWGTAVFVIPSEPREGDYVVALIAGEDNPETQEDRRPSLIVKRLEDELLVSTDSGTVYGDYELRGVVIGQLPIQKICWWMDRGGQKGRDLGIPEDEKQLAQLEEQLVEKKETRRVERVERECKELDLLHSNLVTQISTNERLIFDGKSNTGQTFEVESPRMWSTEIEFSKPQPVRNIRIETTAPITEVEIFDGSSWSKVAELFGGQGGDAAVDRPIKGFRISCGGPTPPGTTQQIRVNEIRCFI